MPASSIASVAGATGKAEKLVNWINQSYRNIQNERDWNWMRREFTAPLLDGTARYDGITLGITDFGYWVEETPELMPFSLYDPDRGVSDEHEIRQVSYEYWFATYGRGSHDHQRPICCAVAPDGRLCFGPTPNKAYVLRGVYIRSPQELVANTDVPIMPARFHDLIWIEAIVKLHAHDDAFESMGAHQMEMIRLRHLLEGKELPEVRLGGGPVA
jgi:hypothetical protein